MIVRNVKIVARSQYQMFHTPPSLSGDLVSSGAGFGHRQRRISVETDGQINGCIYYIDCQSMPMMYFRGTVSQSHILEVAGVLYFLGFN